MFKAIILAASVFMSVPHFWHVETNYGVVTGYDPADGYWNANLDDGSTMVFNEAKGGKIEIGSTIKATFDACNTEDGLLEVIVVK